MDLTEQRRDSPAVARSTALLMMPSGPGKAATRSLLNESMSTACPRHSRHYVVGTARTGMRAEHVNLRR